MSSTPHLSDEQLSAHIDGALPAGESAEVAAHLFSCGECSARVDQLRATSRAVAGLPIEAPPRDLDLGFLHQGEERAGPGPGWIARVIRGRPLPLAAGGLAAAAVLVFAVVAAPGVLNSFRGGGNLAERGPAAQAGGGAQSPEATGSPGAQALTQQGAVPGLAQPRGNAPAPSGNTGTVSVPGADGMTLTLSTASGTIQGTDTVPVVVTLTGGNSDQTLSKYTLSVYVQGAQTGSSRRDLATASGDTLLVRSHGTQEFDFSWTASVGTTGPGAYTLFASLDAPGHATTVQIPITIR